VWSRDIGSPFSFGAFRRADTNCGQNGADPFDISAVERGPSSKFWDHVKLFRSTVFGVIDPNMPFFNEELLIILYMRRKLFFNNAAISKLKEILTSSLLSLKEKIMFLNNIN